MKKDYSKRHIFAIIFLIAFSLIASSFIEGLGINAYAASSPKKPSNVKVIKNNKTAKLTVSWKKLPKKTKVQVYLKAGNGKYKRIGTTSKKSFTTGKLKYGVKYRVKVRTKKGKRYSKFVLHKKALVLTKPASSPKLPSSLKVSKNDKDAGLTLGWKKLPKNTSVEVYLKTGNGNYKRMATTSKSSYTIKKLKYGVKYKIRVRSKIGKKYSKFVTYNNTLVLTNPRKSVARTKSASKQTTTAKSNAKPVTPAKPNSGTQNPTNPTTNPAGAETEIKLVKDNATKIVDQGWMQFVAISFEDGYSKDNCNIVVDGTDITEAVTNVTDDGSVAKWEITNLNPASLTVTSKDGKSKQTIKLSDNASPMKPEVKSRTHADYVMGHAPVSVFDYYLTNYDDQGNVRTLPAKTTFAVKAASDKIRSYSEDAELKTDGTGEVVVMFNYKSDEDKAWFDGVADEGAVELVAFDEQMNTINSRLVYEKTTDYPHGAGTVAAIKVPLGQDNFRTNGRYFLRTKSSAGKAALTAINVVNEIAPSILVTENGAIKSGQNIHFRIENMVEGLKESIETVTLTTPSGETKELTYIDDWFHFGNTGLFVLYNDIERNDGQGVNHTKESGVYTVTIQAAGFKSFSKKFEVSDGTNTSANSGSKTTKRSAVKMDALTGASAVVDDSGSGGSGGSKVSADLLFDVDLLANAIIMDELGMNNEYATAIAERWQTDVIPDYVFSKDGIKFFTWNEYVNAVSDAKLDDGKYLTFAEYAADKNSKTTEVRPSRVKAVLEDNMLGDITDKYLGVSAPELTLEGEYVEEGNDAVFTCSDSNYLDAVKSITASDDRRALDHSYYSIKDDKLIIKASALKLGGKLENDNYFDIKATGYKDLPIVVPYKKILENVELVIDGENHKVGEDVKVLINGSSGDFLKNLETVTVGGSEVYNAMAGGTSGNRYYELSEDKLSLTLKEGLFKTEGSYEIVIKSTYYGEKSVSLEMTAKEVAEEAPDAPLVKSAEKSGNKVKVYFEGDASDTANYLADIRSIKVGEVQYEKALLGLNYNDADRYAASNDPTYGGPHNILELAWNSGFSDDEDTVVSVITNQYKTLTFTISKDGTLVTEGGSGGGDDPIDDPIDDPEEGIDPPAALSFETLSGSSWFSSYKYYYVKLEGGADSEALSEYFSKITEVEVGGYAYTKLSDNEYLSDATGNSWKRYSGSYGRDYHLGLTDGEGFSENANTLISIKAEGYKTLRFEVDPEGNIVS